MVCPADRLTETLTATAAPPVPEGMACVGVARRSSSVAARGEGLRVVPVRRSSSARSTASCCLRRKGSTRSTGSRTSTSSSCGYCLSRSGAALSRKTSTASTGSSRQRQQRKGQQGRKEGQQERQALLKDQQEQQEAQQPQQGQMGRRRSSGSGLPWSECRRRLGQHPHLCLEEDEGEEEAMVAAGEALTALMGRRGTGEAVAKAAARQVSEALRHVHAAGLVHRDVRADNVEVAGRRPMLLRLGGLYRAAEQGTMVRRGAAEEALLPPEVLTLLPAEGYAAQPAQDAWQLGLLLVACLTGALPWAAADPADPHYAAWAAWARRQSTRLPPRFRAFSPRFLRLLRRLLQPRPELRGGVREVEKYLQDAWLTAEEEKGPAAGRLRRRLGGMLARAGASLARLLGAETPAPPSPHTPARVSFTEDPRDSPELLPV